MRRVDVLYRALARLRKRARVRPPKGAGWDAVWSLPYEREGSR